MSVVSKPLTAFSSLVTKSAKRMKKARKKIKSNNYKLNDLVQDTVEFLGDTMQAWVDSVPNPGDPTLPTAFIKKDAAVPTPIVKRVLLPDEQSEAATVTWTSLFQLGASGSIDGATHVDVKLADESDVLEVTLKSLPGGVTAGLYQGLVFNGGEPLATIALLIA